MRSHELTRERGEGLPTSKTVILKIVPRKNSRCKDWDGNGVMRMGAARLDQVTKDFGAVRVHAAAPPHGAARLLAWSAREAGAFYCPTTLA